MRLSLPTAAAHGPALHLGIAGAECDTPYDARVQVSSGVTVIGVAIDPKFGLTACQKLPGRVFGVPARPGVADLTVRCRDSDGKEHLVTVLLSVSANPRSLWRVLPSDGDDPLAKSDEQSDVVVAGDVHLTAASCRGRAHAHRGAFRQDDYRFELLGQMHALLVVADGAGSASLSHEGSRCAVSAVVDSVTRAFSASGFSEAEPPYRLCLEQAALAAVSAVEKRAVELERPFDDFHTTLLISIASLRAPYVVAAFQVGDGMIALCSDAPPAWSGPLCPADQGDFEGQTRFLARDTVSSTGLLKRVTICRPDLPGKLFLGTDGIVDPYFATDGDFADAAIWATFNAALLTAISGPDSRVGVMNWLQAFTPGHHDDRTAAILEWSMPDE